MDGVYSNMSMDDWKLEDITDNISSYGKTDIKYFKSHFNRFKYTINFSKDNITNGCNILDIGCHWLHLSYLINYFNNSTQIYAIDNGITLANKQVQNLAQNNNIKLIEINRLEIIKDIPEIPDNSIDIVYFCEILEHIAFNPISLWNLIYKKLKDGGVIIITTPNSSYHTTVLDNLINIQNGTTRPTISEILKCGTLGHHWKLYSISEIKDYFNSMSSDFCIDSIYGISFNLDIKQEHTLFNTNINKINNLQFKQIYSDIINSLINNNLQPFDSTIIAKIVVNKKNGFCISSPWQIH